MDTEPDGFQAWQVSVQVDGVDRGVATPNLGRVEALQLAHEMNQSVHPLLIAQPWMPTIIAIPAPEEPSRRVFREMMEDLDELEDAPPAIEATAISNPTVEYVVGRWAHLENSAGDVGWSGYIVAGSEQPCVLVETPDGDRQMLPIWFVRAVSEPMERPARKGRR